MYIMGTDGLKFLWFLQILSRMRSIHYSHMYNQFAFTIQAVIDTKWLVSYAPPINMATAN